MKKKKKILISIGIFFAILMILLLCSPSLVLDGEMPIKLLIPENQFNSISSIKLDAYKKIQDIHHFKENGYVAFYIFANWGRENHLIWEKGRYSIGDKKLLIDWKNGSKSEYDLSYIKDDYFWFPKKEWEIDLNPIEVKK